MAFDDAQLRIFFQLFLALVLGGVVGLERELRKKEAGLRTHALVSLGAALFTIIALETFNAITFSEGVRLDLGNVIGAVAIGLGFMGGGIIFVQANRVVGLTTAAGVWVAGAVGVAVGAGFFATAIFATLLLLMVLSVLGALERKVFKKEELG